MKGGSRPFGYWREPLCLWAGAAYAINGWLVPAALQASWWRGHFSDLLLIPVGLPVWLWMERLIGWRRDDRTPRWRDIAFVLVTWTVAAELIAPRLFTRATGDGWDVVACRRSAGGWA